MAQSFKAKIIFFAKNKTALDIQSSFCYKCILLGKRRGDDSRLSG